MNFLWNYYSINIPGCGSVQRYGTHPKSRKCEHTALCIVTVFTATISALLGNTGVIPPRAARCSYSWCWQAKFHTWMFVGCCGIVYFRRNFLNSGIRMCMQRWTQCLRQFAVGRGEARAADKATAKWNGGSFDGFNFIRKKITKETQYSKNSCLSIKLLTDDLRQCFSTAGPRPGTGPWHQLHRAARGSPGICHFNFLSIFHE